MAKTVNTENFPWSIKGISIEARKIAKEAAAKEGVTIGQWLKKIINEDHDKSSRPPKNSPENGNSEITVTRPPMPNLSQSPAMRTSDENMVLELIDQIEKRYLDLTKPLQPILTQLSLRMELLESKVKNNTLADDE